MNNKTKEKMHDILVAIGVIVMIFGSIGFIAYITYEAPIKTEGKVIGTYIIDGRTECVVEIDNERSDTRGGCTHIVGDTVKIDKYKNFVIILRDQR